MEKLNIEKILCINTYNRFRNFEEIYYYSFQKNNWVEGIVVSYEHQGCIISGNDNPKFFMRGANPFIYKRNDFHKIQSNKLLLTKVIEASLEMLTVFNGDQFEEIFLHPIKKESYSTINMNVPMYNFLNKKHIDRVFFMKNYTQPNLDFETKIYFIASYLGLCSEPKGIEKWPRFKNTSRKQIKIIKKDFYDIWNVYHKNKKTSI